MGTLIIIKGESWMHWPPYLHMLTLRTDIFVLRGFKVMLGESTWMEKNQTNQNKRDQLTLRQILTGRAQKISSQSRLRTLHWLQEAGKKTKSWWEKDARHNHILGQSFILHCASLLRISSLLISRRIFPVTRMTYAAYNAQMRDTHGKQNEINLCIAPKSPTDSFSNWLLT